MLWPCGRPGGRLLPAVRAFNAPSAAVPSRRAQALRVAALGVAAVGCGILASHRGSPSPAVMGAIAAASLISSVAGFAFSAICGAVLFHLWDDQVQAVQTMIACSIANQATMVWALRRDVEGRSLRVFLLGGAAGLPAGVWALLHADHTLYTRALGAVLLIYGTYMLACKPRILGWRHPGLDLAAGFPGAPVTVWCGLKGWDKTRQRAVFQPFILLMQVAALFAISAVRPRSGHGAGFDPADLLCLPAGLLGTWLGMTCFRKASNRQFALAVNILLIVSGLSYVV